MVWERQAIRAPDSVIPRSALSSCMGTWGVDQKIRTRQKRTFTTPTALTASGFMIIVNKTGGIYQKQNSSSSHRAVYIANLELQGEWNCTGRVLVSLFTRSLW